MIALLQSTPAAEGVVIPGWMLGLFGGSLILLLGIIGFLLKFVLSTFRDAVKDLKTVIDEAVRAFQSFKDFAPKEFVTYPFFEEARKGLKDDTNRAHKRITDLREEIREDLKCHIDDCPVRARIEART